MDVQVLVPATLTFRLLESRPTDTTEVSALTVGGATYGISPQAFSPTGTLLGSQLFSGSFHDGIGSA